MTTLRAGSATVEITPDWPLSLAGFAVRQGLSTGVAQPLHARALLLESAGPEGRRRSLIVSADILQWGPERVGPLTDEIARRFGIAPDHVVLAATHSHSGPQTTCCFSATVGVADARFVSLLEERVLEAVGAAEANLDAVTIVRHIGTHSLGANRRLFRDGVVHPLPDPDGPKDPNLTVLRFLGANGQTRATIVHSTCHPVISSDRVLSGEFPGVAMGLIERSTGGTALFLQGCCGDINPQSADGSRYFHGGNDEIVEAGAELAGLVTDLTQQDGQALDPVSLSAMTGEVALPFAALPTPDELRAASEQDGVLGDWGRRLLAEPERLVEAATLHLSRLEIARGCTLVTMNAEPSVAYGLHARAVSGGEALPVGYCNGMIGYVPTATQFAEGGYEPDGSTRYYLLPSPFVADIETGIRHALGRLASPSATRPTRMTGQDA